MDPVFPALEIDPGHPAVPEGWAEDPVGVIAEHGEVGIVEAQTAGLAASALVGAGALAATVVVVKSLPDIAHYRRLRNVQPGD